MVPSVTSEKSPATPLGIDPETPPTSIVVPQPLRYRRPHCEDESTRLLQHAGTCISKPHVFSCRCFYLQGSSCTKEVLHRTCTKTSYFLQESGRVQEVNFVDMTPFLNHLYLLRIALNSPPLLHLTLLHFPHDRSS